MSIASELARLQTAKSDLATSIANKGVTVPAATTIDGYAALVDQIQTGGGSPLPQGAVEITYLQGGGSSYIDTGIKASSNIEYEIGITIQSSLPVASTSIANLFGSRIDTANTALTVQYYNTSSSKYWRWVFNNDQKTVNHNGTKGYYVVSNKNNKNTLVTTGAFVSYISCTNSVFSNNLNLYLFAINNAGTANAYGNTLYYIHYCKIYESGSLVRDFIPIRIGQVGYMYDKVSKQSFDNTGTGSFTLGPDVT